MPSSIYRLFARAMADQKFAGDSKSGSPPEGAWKCLRLFKISDAQPRDGPWHGGSRHSRPQL